MLIKFISIIILVFCSILNAQNIDELARIPSEYKEREIRIYKDRGITNSGFVYRIYEDKNKWNAEIIQWFLPKQISSDEFERVNPVKRNLVSKENLEKVFINLEALNIGFLPMEDAFEYKKEKNEVIWDEDNKQFVIQTSKTAILDGTSYSVVYQSFKNYNEFTYSNPERYLEKFPDIDELHSFQEILKYIRVKFNLDF